MTTKTSMGRLPGGEEVFCYRIENASGAYAEISTLGGCLLSVIVPDRNGTLGDVLLGYDRLDTMQAASGYMGMLIGRYANRIGGAEFVLNGKRYQLAANNGKNHLHGGLRGFDKMLWQVQAETENALVLSLTSPDGDEGYPGMLSVKVQYRFTDDNRLCIEYSAASDEDTIVNLTNHAYFNLSGPQSLSIAAHRISIDADTITEVEDAACIPTGKLYPVENTPFDLREMKGIGEGFDQQESNAQMQYGNGYDHNFVLNGWDETLRRACVVHDPASGRIMETWTDQPGVQFYSGNSIKGDTPGKLGIPYVSRQGFCLETQHFPDSIHHDAFPSCILRKGERYRTETEYRFLTDKNE